MRKKRLRRLTDPDGSKVFVRSVRSCFFGLSRRLPMWLRIRGDDLVRWINLDNVTDVYISYDPSDAFLIFSFVDESRLTLRMASILDVGLYDTKVLADDVADFANVPLRVGGGL
jgi:hypothetical protein